MIAAGGRLGRSSVRVTSARPSQSARAALFGWKPISCPMARIRSRVAAETRLAVERERHRRLGHVRAAGDVDDGRTFQALPPRDSRLADVPVPIRGAAAAAPPCTRAAPPALLREPAGRHVIAARLLRMPVLRQATFASLVA
jgi:hypothetical protein